MLTRACLQLFSVTVPPLIVPTSCPRSLDDASAFCGSTVMRKLPPVTFCPFRCSVHFAHAGQVASRGEIECDAFGFGRCGLRSLSESL